MINLENVFSDMNDENFKKMYEIIKFRQNNVLKKVPVSKRDKNYVYCESHHIIPKSWFKIHKLKIDNSSCNVINLTAKEHILVHIYLRKYFENKNTKMFYCMTNALLKMIHGNKELLENLQSDESVLQFVANEIEESKKHVSQIRRLSNIKFWSNLSDSDCTARKQTLRERQKNFWKNMNKLERLELLQKIKLGWKNKTKEEKLKIREKVSQSLKEYHSNALKNMSEEEKSIRKKWYSEHSREMWEKRSEEERIEISKKISNSLKNNKHISSIRRKMHEDMSEDKKRKRIEMIKERNKETWNIKDPEKKKIQIARMTESNQGRIWMYNNEGNVIHPKKEHEEEYLKLGYVKGRKPGNKHD